VLKRINKKESEESSRSVCSADLDVSLGKEQLYRRKITILMFEITIIEIMLIQLYWIMMKNYMFFFMQIYNFYEKKQEAT
jgi:predicted nucleic acid-binding Zn ribbon protein